MRVLNSARRLAILAVAVLAVSACDPASEPATESSAPPAVEERPLPQPAPPTAPPVEAPSEPVTEAPEEAPTNAAEGDQPTVEAAAESSAATAAPPPSPPPIATRSVRRGPVVTPVIVEIDRTAERRASNGGSAVVLFSEGTANQYRNTVTCVNVWNLMDTATTQEMRIGLRKAQDGSIEALRPLYWMNKSPGSAGANCEARLAKYDFVRAKTIKTKYGLTGAGPYFVIARADERAAAVIDLTGRSDREIADLVLYFRDGFAYQNEVWDASRTPPEARRQQMASFFGPRFSDSLLRAIGYVSSPVARAGCRLGDLKDMPCT